MPQDFQGIVSFFVPIIVLIGLMYFMMILPQKKEQKRKREMLDALQVGSELTSIGGIAGKIINIQEDEVTIETSVEKTQIVLKKWAIREVQVPAKS
ncbi:MAG: preprotein translocase subunit YajC [Clostridia bacterium]|nr:preprotein translocase subunit YajC [Clostridia bacterium]